MDLVTGGTGLVGSHVLLELLGRGRDVRAIHRPDSDRSIVLRVFQYYREDGAALFDRIQWVEADLLDVDGLNEAMIDVDRVFHCAAMVSFDPRDKKMLFAVNIGGTAHVVNSALANGVKALVHISSTGATGRSANGKPVDETMPFVNDRHTSPYAVSKYEAELEVQRGVAEGLPAAILNPSVILGAGSDARGSLSIIRRLRSGTQFYPTGSAGIVDARDVALAAVKAADRIAALVTLSRARPALAEGSKGGNGDRYILSAPSITYRELFTRIATGLGRPAPSRAVPPWVLQLAWRIDRLRTLFGGGRSLITRHTVHSALSHRSYDGTKAQRELGIGYRSVEEVIANAVGFSTNAFHRPAPSRLFPSSSTISS